MSQFSKSLAPLLLIAAFRTLAGAQESSETGSRCSSPTVNSVPSRPTFSNSTDTTECGVVEAEYGFERTWTVEGSHHQDFSGGLRAGITPNMDFHWASSDYLSLTANGQTVEGFGDTIVGVKYRFLGQGGMWPGLGLFYQMKIPTGSESEGLGSGEWDYSLSLLVSKDVRPFHFDFNVIPTFLGREVGPGFDRTVGFALTTAMPALRKFTLILEPYGYTRVNSTTPGFVNLTGAVSYQVKPRFFLDAGADAGITEFAPHKRVFGGFTYAIGNAVSWFRPRTDSLTADPARK